MHDGDNLYCFAADHLSSASLTLHDCSDSWISKQDIEAELRLNQNWVFPVLINMPFGEVRQIFGLTAITETEFSYTGQV